MVTWLASEIFRTHWLHRCKMKIGHWLHFSCLLPSSYLLKTHVFLRNDWKCIPSHQGAKEGLTNPFIVVIWPKHPSLSARKRSRNSSRALFGAVSVAAGSMDIWEISICAGFASESSPMKEWYRGLRNLRGNFMNKSEILNPRQARNSNREIRNGCDFSNFSFHISDLSRISSFGF